MKAEPQTRGDMMADVMPEEAEETLTREWDRITVCRALDLPRSTLEDLAAAVGTKQHNLRAYREGRARMPYRVRVALGQELVRIARELDAAARDITDRTLGLDG